METQKTLVMKVVGNGKMHITAKNGVKIQKFSVEHAQTKLNWVECRVNSCLVAFLVKSFSMKPWYAMFGIFLLGTTSHIMTPCTSFPFFLFPLAPFQI
jgi:hypothetical protein